MPKITVHEGVSYDPYAYPDLQPTTETKILETDIKEVADQDEDTKYVKPEEEEDEDSSVGNSSFESDKSNTKTTKRNESESSRSVFSVAPRSKKTP